MSYDRETRRKRRERNQIAKDLNTRKYRQRVVPNKKKKKEKNIDDWYFEADRAVRDGYCPVCGCLYEPKCDCY